MKKFTLFLTACFFTCFSAFTLKAQTVYPYLTPLQNFGGTVVDLSTVGFSASDYTLQVEGSIANEISVGNSYSYIPTENATVRFSQKDGIVYVYEGNTYKGTLTPSLPSAENFATITDTDPFTNNLLSNASFETAGDQIVAGKYQFGSPWETNVAVAEFGIRCGTSDKAVNGSKVAVWRGTANSNYLSQPVTGLKPYTFYKVIARQIDKGNASAYFNFGIGSAVGELNYGSGQIYLGSTLDAGTYTCVFLSSSNTTDGYFTFKNTSTNTASSGSDPVTQLDYFALVEGLSCIGITGVTSATMLEGAAYAPEGVADFNAGDSYNMTSFIVNPNFSNGTTGWTSTAGAQNKGTAANQDLGAFLGTMPFWEHWNGSAFTGKMYQVVNNLPAGKYKLEMGVFANNGGDGLFVYAGESETAVSNATIPTSFTTNVSIPLGSLEIGLNIKSGTNNWIGIDNVKLYYTGPASEPALAVSTTETILLTEANPTASFTITGANLTDVVSIVSNNAVVVPDATSISAAEAEAGKAITLTFDGSATENITITVSSSSLTKTVTVITSKDSDCFVKTIAYESEINLITDPYVLNKTMGGWGNRAFLIDPAIAYCGATCARIYGGSYDVALSSYEANTTYIASAWINPNANGTIRFGAHNLGSSDAFTNLTSAGTDYELVTLEFTTAANPGAVSLHFNGASATGAYIDNVQVYKKEIATSIDSQTANALSIKAIQGGLSITSSETTKVDVYSATGKLVKSLTVSGSESITLVKGLYVVKTGDLVQKLIVK